jgi:hypothetical protein
MFTPRQIGGGSFMARHFVLGINFCGAIESGAPFFVIGEGAS